MTVGSLSLRLGGALDCKDGLRSHHIQGVGLFVVLLLLLEEAGIYFVLRLDNDAASSIKVTCSFFVLDQRCLCIIHLIVLMLLLMEVLLEILAVFTSFELLSAAQSL